MPYPLGSVLAASVYQEKWDDKRQGGNREAVATALGNGFWLTFRGCNLCRWITDRFLLNDFKT